MTRRHRAVFAGLTVLWLAVTIGFWAWWLAPSQVGTPVLYAIATACLAYLTTFLPSFYWFFVARMRRPVHQAPSAGRRVAMITLCVPSMESLDVIEAQLKALRAVRYPHDSWILDEGDDPDVRRLAAAHGVRYFTRKDIPRWNEPRPPFQAKTKAGNVNAWLDHVQDLGLDYDVFVQMDIDHTPKPEYLERTLGYFDDPDVAWVQAPSVASNLDSWTARGLAEQDVVLQGPLQMGFYGHSRTPFIIGSHTSYRTSAIRAIGGFQPTRAEDHLDTVVLAANGFTGVYVPEIIAEGDGPEGLGTYMGQQFAWAYSMVQIFLHHTPKLVRRYTKGQAFQFLMAQSWYTLWSLSIALLWALPLVALLTGLPIGSMDLLDFLVRYLAVLLTSTLMWWWTRRWFQPAGVNLTWRGVLLEIARWPIVLYAVVNVLLRVKRPYMITPKGEHAGRPVSGRKLYGLHLALAWLALGAIAAFVFAIGASPTAGYVVLTLGNVLMVLALVITTLGLELRDLRVRLGGLAALRLRAGSIAATAGTAAAALAACAAVWPFIVGAL
ncbi:MAG: glycosyltransferase [Solirubrobacteraceae bacterium]|nr:glycosyltransferase [Solirubrobacteraceae bacterium]